LGFVFKVLIVICYMSFSSPPFFVSKIDLDISRKLFYDEGGETLEHIVWRGGRCPIPGNIQGQVVGALGNLI